MSELAEYTDVELHTELARRRAVREAEKKACFQAYLNRWAETPLPAGAEDQEVDNATYARSPDIKDIARHEERSHAMCMTFQGKQIALAARTQANVDEFAGLPRDVQKGICALIGVELLPEALAWEYARLRITLLKEGRDM